MNLFDMATRKDPNLVLVADAVIFPSASKAPRSESATTMALTKQTIDSRKVKGLHVIAGGEPARIRIKSIFSYFPFSDHDDRTDWKVVPISAEGQCTVSVAVLDGANVLASTTDESSHLIPIEIRIPAVPASSRRSALDLEISISNTGRRGATLIDHEILNRAGVVSACKGVGVEIGPGTNPQIRPSGETAVIYVEQSSPEQWSELYVRGKPIDKSLWANYRIGEAHKLPVDDESLDFIFCSHVFEHLANPLGHLQYWRSKLHENGKVVAILPTVTGSKDYVFQPCKLEELVTEFAEEKWEPTLRHYERWAKYRAPGSDPGRLMAAKRSIHVHFYDRKIIEQLLQFAVDELEYSSFEIEFVPNHKDMHFVLSR